MGREHLPISPTAGTARISGQLGDALQAHARTRVTHFFKYLWTLDAACRRAAVLAPAAPEHPADVFDPKATLQVDTGRRSGGGVGYTDFDDTDPAVVTKFATAFRNVDAAHFCNLGLKAGPWARLSALATSDEHLFALMNMVKAFSADTRLLPQRVNIGPDRVVDVAHGVLAERFLRPRAPTVTRANIEAYLDVCATDMGVYRATHVGDGNHGIAACCDSYLTVYAGGPDAALNDVRGGVWAECGARRGVLNEADYLG